MKKFILAFFILSLFLPSCLPMARRGHKSETFQILITIHYSQPFEIREEYEKSLRANGLPVDALKLKKVRGFAEWNEPKGKGSSDIRMGTIYVPKPRKDRSDPKVERIIGHEIRHIVEGHFHK